MPDGIGAVDLMIGFPSVPRVFEEMRNVPFGDEAWPKFLRGNAMRMSEVGAES
jgi:hypothetical protein